VDIWSLGVIAYTLLFGKPPFETSEVKTTYEKIKACDYSFPHSKVSDSAKQFVMKMLKLNPADRATINELLADQFLTSEEVPRTLPRSTLACPPSKAYL
jgi:polo-like kinase 1